MIKRNLRPPVLIMAEPAIIRRIIFCLDKTFVKVRVAVRTACTDLPETPLFLFLMAFEARGCGMGFPQGKGAGVMLRHRICEIVKAFYSMALRTIRRDSVAGKLAAMIICMAISAPVMPEGVSGLTLMAILASNFNVLLLKFKIRLVMVKP
jgi:hypothetical protein